MKQQDQPTKVDVPAVAEEYTIKSPQRRFIRPVERQRMRPWLIDHLDRNDIAGLCWQNRREKIFRIAWKHAANQCFNMEKDTSLFEKWAIHTGRHFDSDHKRWKANFRCALNSLPDVAEMKDQGIRKGNNAFKVYKFLDEKDPKLVKEVKHPTGRERIKRESSRAEAPEVHNSDESDTDKLYIGVHTETSTPGEGDVKPGVAGDHNYAEFEALKASRSDNTWQKESVGQSNLPNFDELSVSPTRNVSVVYKDSRGKITRSSKGAIKDEPGSSTSGEGQETSPTVGFSSLQEILDAASKTYGEVKWAIPSSLSSLTIEQLDKLGRESVRAIRLDVRRSDGEGEKVSKTPITSFMFLCQWCEKCFSEKMELFHHFLTLHQDMLAQTGSAITSDINSSGVKEPITSQQLQEEIAVLEEEVLKNYKAPNTETVIEDGEVQDFSLNSDLGDPEIIVDPDLALDLSVKPETTKEERQEEALDLTTKGPINKKQTEGGQTGSSTFDVKDSSSEPSVSEPDISSSVDDSPKGNQTDELPSNDSKKDGPPGFARQRTIEDILHAEILMSLKAGVSSNSPSGDVTPEECPEPDAISLQDSTTDSQPKKGKMTAKKSEQPAIDNRSNLDKVIEGVARNESNSELSSVSSAEKVGEESEAGASSIDDDGKGMVTGSLFEEKDGKSMVMAKELEVSNGKGDEEDEILVPDLKEMIKASSATYPYKCVVCGRTYTRDIYLVAHLRSHTGLILYRCGICGKTFSDNGTLKRHVKTHKKPFLYKCNVCKEEFQQSFGLKIHMKDHKSTEPSEEFFQEVVPEKVYKCKQCGKRLRQGTELNIHIQAHLSRTCEVCNIEFEDLAEHMKKHTEERPYICNLCEKSFSASDALSSHVKSHLRDKIVYMEQFKKLEKKRGEKSKGDADENEKKIPVEGNKELLKTVATRTTETKMSSPKSLLAAVLTTPPKILVPLVGNVITKENESKGTTLRRVIEETRLIQTPQSPVEAAAKRSGNQNFKKQMSATYMLSKASEPVHSVQTAVSKAGTIHTARGEGLPIVTTSIKSHGDKQQVNLIQGHQVILTQSQGQSSRVTIAAVPLASTTLYQDAFMKNVMVSRTADEQVSSQSILSNIQKRAEGPGSISNSQGKVNFSRPVSVTNLPFGSKAGTSGITWMCTVCQEEYASYTDLENHAKSHIPSGECVECQFCEQKFYTKAMLINHYNSSHTKELVQSRDGNGFVCAKCQQIFEKEEAFKYHMANEHGIHQASLVCPHCNELYEEDGKMTKFCNIWHAKRVTRRLKVEIRPQGEKNVLSSTTIVCTQCGRVCSNQSELTNHMDVHWSVIPYICHGCDTFFLYQKPFSLHIKHCQKASALLKCQTCYVFFSSKEAVEKHRRFHEQQKPNTCKFCNKDFPALVPLNKHLLLEHDKVMEAKKFRCAFCANLFENEKALKSHVVAHTEVGPFGCGVCFAEFRKKEQFCAHIISHQDLTPSVSVEQIKDALQKKEVPHSNSNLRSHSNSKPNKGQKRKRGSAQTSMSKLDEKNKCSTCQLTFSSSYKLKQHNVFTHFRPRHRHVPYSRHLVENLKCSYSCKKCGCHQSSMVWQPTHKVYTCEECESTFRTKCALSKHRLTHKKSREPVEASATSNIENVSTEASITSNIEDNSAVDCNTEPVSVKVEDMITDVDSISDAGQTTAVGISAKLLSASSRGFGIDEISEGSLPVTIDLKDAYICCICSLPCLSMSGLRMHVLKIHQNDVTMCKKCDFVAPTAQSMQDHEGSVHSIESDNRNLSESVTSSKPVLYGEPMIADAFSDSKVLVIRRNPKRKIKPKVSQKQFILTKKRLFGCGVCNKSFFKPLKLNKHVWDHRRNDSGKTMETVNPGSKGACTTKTGSSVQDKMFMCMLCRTKYSDSSELYKHAKVHTTFDNGIDDDECFSDNFLPSESTATECDSVEMTNLTQVKSEPPDLEPVQVQQQVDTCNEESSQPPELVLETFADAGNQSSGADSKSFLNLTCDLCQDTKRFKSMVDLCVHAINH